MFQDLPALLKICDWQRADVIDWINWPAPLMVIQVRVGRELHCFVGSFVRVEGGK